MTRIDDCVNYDEVENFATANGLRVRHGAARCEHGKTSEQECRSCENGYVYDTHYFVRLAALEINGVKYAAVSDDGYYAVTIPPTVHNKKMLNRKGIPWKEVYS